MRRMIAPYAERLAEAGVAVPWLEARLLVGLALGKEGAVYSHEDAVPEALVDGAVDARLEALLARRLKGEPLSRMRGWREFWSMRFGINAACLDPRPDSETLVAAAIAYCHASSKARLNIWDYGTGSGCLLLAVLAHCQNAHRLGAAGLGLDCQKGAIAMARENALAHGLDSRAQWLVSHWCDALDENARADVILANPPYIATAELAGLMPEVRGFEPRLALDGGVDGLEAWRQLMPRFARRLRADGAVFVEIGAGQESAVIGLAASHDLCVKATYRDIHGIIRVVEFTKQNGENGN